jgi:hypothetical protein
MEKETKLRKIKVLSYVFLAFVFIIGIIFYSKIEKNNASAEIIKAFTEKNNYSVSDELKVEIENKESQTVCFSSCYPYIIQIKKDTWDNYSYPQCDKENVAETCINPNQSKAFAIALNEMSLEPTMHRLAIPACIGCAIGEQFRVDKIIYSNEFEIKK